MFNKICTVAELLQIPIQESNEPLVYFPTILKENVFYKDPDYLGSEVVQNHTFFWGRLGLLSKLQEVLSLLSPLGYGLIISNIYRAPKIQVENFKKFYQETKTNFPHLSEQELIEKAHIFIAYPEVAGHPTGGAIDLTLHKDGIPLDMGCNIGDFTKEELLPYKSDYITAQQLKNRTILRETMIKSDFAPFNGEWWHFSYGDREWAAILKRDHAIYSAKEI